MDPFFKSPSGRICNYAEMKPRADYSEPFYTREDEKKVDAEPRKFLFASNEDFRKMRRELQAYERVLEQVKI